MPEVQYKVGLPAFTGRNVPIKEIAKAMGKDAQYVRVGIQQGVIICGVAKMISSTSSEKTDKEEVYGKNIIYSSCEQ